MRDIVKLLVIWFVTAFVTACSVNEASIHTEFTGEKFAPPAGSGMVENYIEAEDALPESSKLEQERITKVSWKVIDYGGPPYYHLYVTLNDEEDYYAGYFYGENFETGEWADTPDNALTAAGADWTGAGELFYIYQKNETELALLNHSVSYAFPREEWEEYHEILTIPIPEGSKIEIGDVADKKEQYGWSQDYALIIYDSYILGGLDRSNKLVSVFETDWDQCWQFLSNWGFRLFKDGQYLDTISYIGFDEEWLRTISTGLNDPANSDCMMVELIYKGKFFDGLALNDGSPLTFGPKIQLDPSADPYENYIAGILAENGLEEEPVHISQIVKTDLEGDGVTEVLIVASNINSSGKVKGQYSIVVLRKIMDGEVKSIFLTKQIKNVLPDEERLLYDYELREIVDLDHDGVCELLFAETYYEGRFYLVYKMVHGEMQLVLENGFGV